MPRLYREAPVNAIWEGSGNVICLDVLRAAAREPASLAAFMAEVGRARGLDARLDRAAAALAADPARFGDRAAANLLWALGALGHSPGAGRLDGIAAAALPLLPRYSAHSLSLVAWAYATLGHRPSDSFLEAVGSGAARGVASPPGVDSHSLSMAAWALGTLGRRHDAFLRALAGDCAARRRLPEFEPRHLGTTLWGMAKVGFDPGAEFMRDAAEVSERAPRLCASSRAGSRGAGARVGARPPASLCGAPAAQSAGGPARALP